MSRDAGAMWSILSSTVVSMDIRCSSVVIQVPSRAEQTQDLAALQSTKAQELMVMDPDARVEAICRLPVDMRNAVYAILSAEAVAQLDFSPHIPERFHDLMAANGGCIIPDTALRAVSLDQLKRIMEHMKCRLASGEEVMPSTHEPNLPTP